MFEIINTFYRALANGEQIDTYLAQNVQWGVSHPINDLTGADQVLQAFWRPIKTAMPDVERRVLINVGHSADTNGWVCATGYFIGTLRASLYGIPATGKTLYLRFTEMTEVSDGKIQRSYIILDFLDAMNQVGVNPLRKSLGHDGLVLPPATQDGLVRCADNPAESDKTAALVKGMLAELGRFDGKSLRSMQLEKYWHPDFMWYGPAGIGTTRGIEGFRQHHQGPFVFAFPDRGIDLSLAFLASGHYAATGGWPHMHGTHTGEGWLGLPPTRKSISLRVMDIWRREGELLVENWVAIDIIHMLQQMGLDVFAQMHSLSGSAYGRVQ